MSAYYGLCVILYHASSSAVYVYSYSTLEALLTGESAIYHASGGTERPYASLWVSKNGVFSIEAVTERFLELEMQEYHMHLTHCIATGFC